MEWKIFRDNWFGMAWMDILKNNKHKYQISQKQWKVWIVWSEASKPLASIWRWFTPIQSIKNFPLTRKFKEFCRFYWKKNFSKPKQTYDIHDYMDYKSDCIDYSLHTLQTRLIITEKQENLKQTMFLFLNMISNSFWTFWWTRG